MQDLPVEVWRLVFDDLSRTDLCSLCLTSPQFQAIAQPHLFSNIEYNWVSPKSEEDLAWDLDLESPLGVASLVRALHGRPDLAEAVRCVSLLCSRSSVYETGVKLQTDDDDFKDLVQVASLLKLPFAMTLSQAVADGLVDGFVTLLLALTPGITHLKLTEEFASQTHMLSRLILYTSQHPDNTASSLKHLSHVHYVSFHIDSSDELLINTDNVTPFFYLPDIQSITADIQEPPTFAWPLPSPPAMTKLTSLTLTRTREMTLSILLEHAKSLKYLEWVWIYDDVFFGYRNEPVMDRDTICEALDHVRATLTTLKLRGCSQSSVVDQELDFTGSMRGLAKMTALTTLETTLQFFMGFEEKDYTVPFHECLPPSLKEACFMDDFVHNECLKWTGAAQTDVVETWWKVKREQTPKLEALELRCYLKESMNYFWPTGERERLAELGEEYGVTLELSTLEKETRWRLNG